MVAFEGWNSVAIDVEWWPMCRYLVDHAVGKFAFTS